MKYVKHFSINGIDTKQVACIELNGRPNTATEGAVGLLGVDITSPTHEVYKCVAVNGSIYTWELLSAGMSVISAKITGEGGASKSFPYSALLIPDNYLIKMGDLIIDSEGYLYQISSIENESCTATYCGTHIGGIASGDKDYSLVVTDGKLQLVTESGNVISNIDYLVPDGITTARDAATGKVKTIGIYTIGDTALKIFYGTQADYNNLTDAQKANLFPIITDNVYVKESTINEIKNGTIEVGALSKSVGTISCSTALVPSYVFVADKGSIVIFDKGFGGTLTLLVGDGTDTYYSSRTDDGEYISAQYKGISGNGKPFYYVYYHNSSGTRVERTLSYRII